SPWVETYYAETLIPDFPNGLLMNSLSGLIRSKNLPACGVILHRMMDQTERSYIFCLTSLGRRYRVRSAPRLNHAT
ncbi:hypothetical protein, partial [Sphingobium yanoikuyae]|uniref:hypothetical protein n=1 Tax=Sphingobium yanoikuyae TaxID=13690 RepID=UPI001BDEB5E9